MVGPLLASGGHQKSFLQAHFLDADETNQRLAAVSRAMTHGSSSGAISTGGRSFGRITPDQLSESERAIFGGLQQLDAMLKNRNDLVRQFLTARERVRAIEDAAGGAPVPSLRVIISEDARPDGTHVRFYNDVASGEAAAVLPMNELENPPEAAGGSSSREMVLRVRAPLSSGDTGPQQVLRKIKPTSRFHEPAQYPLIFPFGTHGWHTELKQTGGRRLTLFNYGACRAFTRQNDFNHLHRLNQFFGVYLVDSFMRVEHSWLDFRRHNQRRLWCEAHNRIVDAVSQGAPRAGRIGRGVVLGPPFTGGARWYREKYADRMAVVRALGHPDLFVTFTANPQWKEIHAALFPSQTSQDRPDTVGRVFHMKLQQLLELLTKQHIFGRCTGHMASIEFEKRGLPHVHILLLLDAADRPQTADVYDKFISAEIPSATANPVLRASVLAHMVHGPCVGHNPGVPCIQPDGSCSKRYPREFVNHSIDSEDSYQMYRRRPPDDGGERAEITRRGVSTEIDNRWNVPYSPCLISVLDNHCNLEVCSCVRAVKYLFKYICKGTDRAMVSIVRTGQGTGSEAQQQQPIDDIQEFLDARFIGESEAAWRLLSFEMVYRFPALMKLSVNLENEPPVYFAEGEEEDARRAAPRGTTLTAFFDLNSANPDGQNPAADTLLYADVPRYFTWVSRTRTWKRWSRVAGPDQTPPMIGRIPGLSPAMGEFHYLRMLLYRVRGPHSFADLRTHANLVHPNFKAACLARNMLSGEEAWDSAMEEATLVQMPALLRRLLACLLVHCDVPDAAGLFERHFVGLSEDVTYRLNARQAYGLDERATVADVRRLVLLDIDQRLQEMGRRLADFNLVVPPAKIGDDGAPNQFLGEAPEAGTGNTAERSRQQALARELPDYREALLELVAQRTPTLQPDQRGIWELVRDALDAERGERIFLDAPGGCGKAYLAEVMLSYCRGKGHVGLAVASSGIAATLLPQGRTAHSCFKIHINVDGDTICTIPRQGELTLILRHTRPIVWDDVAMAHRHCFEAVDRSIRDAVGDDCAARIVWVVCGDFLEVPPVVRQGSVAQIVRSSLRKSHLWPSFQRRNLSVKMRVQRLANAGQADEASLFSSFARWVLSIGNGTVRPVEELRAEELAAGGYLGEPSATDLALEAQLRRGSPRLVGRAEAAAAPRRRRAGESAVQACISQIRIPRNRCMAKGAGMSELLDWVFQGLAAVDVTGEAALAALGNRMILTPLNKDVGLLNDMAVNIFPGEVREYLSINSVVDADAGDLGELYTQEYLNTIDHASVPNHRFCAKVGMPVMLLRNLAAQTGDCNGSRYLIKRLGVNIIVVTTFDASRMLIIPRIDCDTSDCALRLRRPSTRHRG